MGASEDRTGRLPHNQQAMEDGAALLAGMFGLADAHAAGRIDIEAARADVVRRRIATCLRWGHALESFVPDGETVGEIDTVLGAHSAWTTAHHMGACLGELERSELAWADAMGVLHGRA